MWEAISAWGGWNEVGAAGAWLVTLCLLAIGLVGCFLPVIPGPLIILMAAVFHWFVFREGSGVEWWTFAVLIALLAASQIFDFVSGAAGSKWFGGTKWGVAGVALKQPGGSAYRASSNRAYRQKALMQAETYHKARPHGGGSVEGSGPVWQ